MRFPSLRGTCQVVLLAALVLSSTQALAQDANADIYGKWKITGILGGGIGSLSARQERNLIGKPLLISPERFEFNGQTCFKPRYERSREDPNTYFDREWRTDVSDIPFPNPVTIIETGCDYLYPIRKDHLMIAERGTFFEAVRIKSVPSQDASARRR
jgi:hypothetical protein